MALHHLIYLSTPTASFSDEELHKLLAMCQTNNAARGLTGILFYGPQHFLQLLEGEQPTVQALYDYLHHDPRHRNLLKLADKPIATRALPDWSMALRPLNVPGLAGTAGLRDLAQLDVAALGLTDADTMLLRLIQDQLLSS